MVESAGECKLTKLQSLQNGEKNLCTCENTIWSLLSRCSFLLLFLHFFPLSSLLCLLSSLLTSFLLLYCFLLGFWFLSLLLSSNSFSFFFFFLTHFCFLSSHLSLVFVFESGCLFFFFFNWKICFNFLEYGCS